MALTLGAWACIVTGFIGYDNGTLPNSMTHSNSNFRVSGYLAPRHWPTWAAVALFRLLAALPYSWQLQLGAGLGHLSRHLLPRRHRVVATNVALAFPHLPPAQREYIVKDNLRNTGIAIFETLQSWWADEEWLRNHSRIEGLEHIERALGEGRGAILLGGHFTPMMLCGRMLALKHPFCILAKKAKNPLFEALMQHYRQKHYAGVIDSRNLRAMVRALKENQVCWYAPDQDFGRKHTIFVPFMGIPAATLTITARLAKLTGAPVLPIAYQRLPGTMDYRIVISPPLATFPSNDPVADAKRVNEIIEAEVRKSPAQYLWVHRRFKTRPPGEKRPYY